MPDLTAQCNFPQNQVSSKGKRVNKSSIESRGCRPIAASSPLAANTCCHPVPLPNPGAEFVGLPMKCEMQFTIKACHRGLCIHERTFPGRPALPSHFTAFSTF